MPKIRRPVEPPDEDPNRLIRQAAGTYRTPDERFEVRHGALGWFLVDSAATNDFGQELVRGPFGTLEAARDALPEARRTTMRPVPRQPRAKPGGARPGGAKPGSAKPPPPPPPPPSWLDGLPKGEAASARSLIRALEREGIDGAEELVRADREGQRPVAATRLLEQRLEALVDGVPVEERERLRDAVRRVAELLSVGGAELPDPLPGWALVELGRGSPPPPNRRILLRRPRRRG